MIAKKKEMDPKYARLAGEDAALAVSHADGGFVARLNQIVEAAGGASGLARKAGISPSGLSRYLAGGEPSRRVLVALADAAGVRIDWLARGVGAIRDGDTPPLPGSTLRLLPLMPGHDRHPKTGKPQSDFTAQAFCYKWLNDNGLDITSLKVMTVRGDGMAPTLCNGDTVLIDTQDRDIEDGRIYLLNESGNMLLRRLHVEAGNRIRALADNPQHHAFVQDATEIEIVGRVVWRGSVL